jgi:hypothetical protein
MSRRPRARRVTQPITLQKPRDPAIEPLGFRCFRLFRVPRGFDVMVWFDHTHMMAAFTKAA